MMFSQNDPNETRTKIQRVVTGLAIIFGVLALGSSVFLFWLYLFPPQDIAEGGIVIGLGLFIAAFIGLFLFFVGYFLLRYALKVISRLPIEDDSIQETITIAENKSVSQQIGGGLLVAIMLAFFGLAFYLVWLGLSATELEASLYYVVAFIPTLLGYSFFRINRNRTKSDRPKSSEDRRVHRLDTIMYLILIIILVVIFLPIVLSSLGF